MLKIFEYTDYRKYLKDYYDDCKNRNQSFSYNGLSIKAGLKSKGTLHDVLHGKRNLSKQSVVKLAMALGLRRNEADYFENLVFFNQATELKERNYFYERMEAVKPDGQEEKEVQQLRKDQYEFYSKWYHSAIRSLIDMYPFKDDYAWLARNVYPAILPHQAKKSVELLEKLGLIEKKEDEFYKLAQQSITTGGEVRNLAALNFHKEAMHLAENCLDQLSVDERHISGLTLGFSKETYQNICDEIKTFRSKIIQLVEKDNEADRAYQLNFHFFPITRTDVKTRTEEKPENSEGLDRITG